MGLLAVLKLIPPAQTSAQGAPPEQIDTSARSTDGTGVDVVGAVGGTATTSPVGGPPPTGGTPATAGTPTGAGPLPPGAPASTAATTPVSTTPTSNSDSAVAAATALAVKRATVLMLVVALKTHSQQGRIGKELGDIDTKVAQADADALAGNWSDADAKLEQAKGLCVTAKKLADDWAAFAKARASAGGIGPSLRGFSSPAAIAGWNALVADADKDVAKTPPKFADAMTKLAGIEAVLKPGLTADVAAQRAVLTKLEAMDAKVKSFVAKDIADAKKLITACEAALAANQWAECIRTKNVASRILGPASRVAPRRAEYETKLAAAKTAVSAVRGNAATQPYAAALDTDVAKADVQANTSNRNFEEANRLVDGVKKRADVLTTLAPTIASHDSERKLADTELATLDGHAAAARVEEARTSVRQQLQALSTLVGMLPGGNDPATGWKNALTAVQRARADLAVARKLADDLAGSVAADAAAAKTPPDLAAIKKSLATLRTEVVAARKASNAAVAEPTLKTFDKRAAEADAAITKSEGKAAAKALAACAAAVTEAKAMLAENQQFAAALPAAEAELKALQALPNAKILKPRIDAVTKAIGEAKTRDKAHDGAAAMAAARRALDAAASARRDDASRIAFATESTRVGVAIDGLADAKTKAALKKMLADADKLGDQLKFGEASAALKKLEQKADEAKLKATMAANPADPAIIALASKITAAGGGTVIDDMLQKLPNDAASRQLLTKLAEGRYGVGFTLDAGADPAQEMKTMKRLCKMFAKVPNDIRGNTSVSGVQHTDAIGDPGGDHSPDTAMVKMKGRPDEKDLEQQFGSKLTAPDPSDPTGKKQIPQLPADIDPACKPANEKPIDFLDFAALHEVGHGVDDAKGVMRQNMNDEAFGAWKVFGTDVKPIADAVGAHFNFYATPEEKKYVLDKIASQEVTEPKPPTPPGDWAARKKNFDDWHAATTAPNFYRRQSDCDKWKIGDRIYQEAYAREWVSYSAAARKKGLTGYQFRAPSEFFAELYAGYHTGKLGKSHPALAWLKKL